MGKSSIDGSFSMAMLNNQRVIYPVTIGPRNLQRSNRHRQAAQQPPSLIEAHSLAVQVPQRRDARAAPFGRLATEDAHKKWWKLEKPLGFSMIFKDFEWCSGISTRRKVDLTTFVWSKRVILTMQHVDLLSFEKKTSPTKRIEAWIACGQPKALYPPTIPSWSRSLGPVSPFRPHRPAKPALSGFLCRRFGVHRQRKLIWTPNIDTLQIQQENRRLNQQAKCIWSYLFNNKMVSPNAKRNK